MSGKERTRLAGQLKAIPIRKTTGNAGRLSAVGITKEETDKMSEVIDQLDTQLFGLNNSGYNNLEEYICAVVNYR